MASMIALLAEDPLIVKDNAFEKRETTTSSPFVRATIYPTLGTMYPMYPRHTAPLDRLETRRPRLHYQDSGLHQVSQTF